MTIALVASTQRMIETSARKAEVLDFMRGIRISAIALTPSIATYDGGFSSKTSSTAAAQPTVSAQIGA